MKVRDIKQALKNMPDSFDITVRDYTSNIWSNIEGVTVKHSADRVYINFIHGE